MSGEIEAAGEIATGAFAARAVESRAGENASTSTALCLNCGTRLDGAYCHACGQAGHVHRTMMSIVHDLLHGVFHFEGKIWRTLPMLVLRPGELTRRYAAGERARFVSPMAMFLFSVFLMFAVVANLPGWNFGGEDFLEPGVSGGVAKAREKLGQERVRAEKSLAQTRQRLARERAKASPDPDIIQRNVARLATADRARRDLALAERSLSKPTTFDVDDAPLTSSSNWLDAKFRHATENPKLLLYKIKTSAYKFSWALIPLSLPLIWLLFPLRRDVGMYDHAVFATYSLTFMSLLAILLAVLSTIGVPTWMVIVAAMSVPPFHIYRQLKGAYRLGRAGALWRTAWMLTFANVSISMFALLLVYLGVAD